MAKKKIHIRQMLHITYWVIVFPALFLILLLTFYTIQRQTVADTQDYKERLSLYCDIINRTLTNSEKQLSNITALQTPFQAFHYCDTQLKKHNYAWETMNVLKPLLTQEPLFGGIFLYSEDFSYYYPTYQMNYPYPDQALIKSFLTNTPHSRDDMDQWIPFTLSDRVVLIRISGFESTICAFMIDPSLDHNLTSEDDIPSNEAFAFLASCSGTPYTRISLLKDTLIPSDTSGTQTISLQNRSYQFLQRSLANYDLKICYLIPSRTLFQRLNLFQKFLLAMIAILLLCIPVIWNYLFKKLIAPLNELSNTMLEIGNGNFSLHANEDQPISELADLSQTFNQMLDDIKQLKLDSYEKKLDLQQARLQYLQLQIRPHFYLNCMKGLYGMAEKKQYKEIQETLLALSDYFRYIFRNNLNLVSLSKEIEFVSNYKKLQHLNFDRNFTLTMDIDAESADIQILPLSILTFVENSVKHCTNPNTLHIHIKSALLKDDENTYLNLTISDNGGGFSQEMLDQLNHFDDDTSFLYKDYHTGIYNIFYRMKLTYGDKGILAFYNRNNGGCVDLYYPLLSPQKEDNYECTNRR